MFERFFFRVSKHKINDLKNFITHDSPSFTHDLKRNLFAIVQFSQIILSIFKQFKNLLVQLFQQTTRNKNHLNFRVLPYVLSEVFRNTITVSRTFSNHQFDLKPTIIQTDMTNFFNPIDRLSFDCLRKNELRFL